MTHPQPLHRRASGDREQALDEGDLDESALGDEAISSPAGVGLPTVQSHSRRGVGLAAVALLSISAMSLWLNLHFSLKRGDKLGGAERSAFTLPVKDPTSLMDHSGISGLLPSEAEIGSSSGAITELGSISVAQMERIPMGSSHTSQGPLFWILTAPQNEETRCQEIIDTWGQRLPKDSLIFLGAKNNHTSPSGHRFVQLPAPPDKKAIKEFLAWQFVVKSFPNREWFVKGDDDTYFVIQNMNRYLADLDPRLPYFLGCKFHFSGPGGIQYVSGGAGYVLSSEAAQRLADATLRCLQAFGPLPEGDLAIAQCLQTVGVFPEDTRDEHGRQRFHAFPLQYHKDWYKNGMNAPTFWYHKWAWGPVLEGARCCGDNTSVSFHYMADKMRSFDFPPKGAAVASSASSQDGQGTQSPTFLGQPQPQPSQLPSVATETTLAPSTTTPGMAPLVHSTSHHAPSLPTFDANSVPPVVTAPLVHSTSHHPASLPTFDAHSVPPVVTVLSR